MSARTLLLRDWRGGELGVLLAALVLAVGVVVGISAFVSSLQSALLSESMRFLAADRVVSSSRELPAAWRERAKAEQLATSVILGFPSMAVTEADNLYLVSVKAVSDGYPLKGSLQISQEPFGPLESTGSIPALGEAWLAPRLFTLLEVSLGDQVWIGDKALTISGTIRSEPDSSTALFGYGPRLMMNLADIPETGVIQPGSRVNWRLLLTGAPERLDAFTEWVATQLTQGQRILGIDDNQPRISRTLDRAQGFLLLAGSLGVVLAAAAIALAARRFAERHTDYVAIMKSLGASTGYISRLYGASMLQLGLAATLLGCLAGWGIQALFFALFAEQLGVEPGAIGLEPYLIGGATSLVCLGFFAWPPLQRLSRVPPLRVLRRDLDAASAQRSWDYVLGALATIGLMWWYSGDIRLTGGVVAGLLVTVALGYVAARALLRSGRLVGSAAGSVWRLALAGLQRRGASNALQMVIFAVAIMLMLVLIMVRTSLLDQWQAQLPEGTPNHFILNISEEQVPELTQFFDRNGIASQVVYPMTRGRVMAVNGKPLADPDAVMKGDRMRNGAPGDQSGSTGSTDGDAANSRGNNDDDSGENDERRQRESNFTWSEVLPEANELLEGEWWSESTQDSVVSLEKSFAERIGAQVGDELTFRIGADEFNATLTSIRDANWQSMKPNFFVIFPRGVLERFPRMYLTSFFLAPEKKATLNRLLRQFPTVTIIELDIVIDEIRTIVSRVGQAIELVLGVILAAGALVLIAGVQASVDVRLKESALLRALGARKGLLLGALWIEFATLGLFAGLLAVAGAEVSAWALQTQALDLDYQATPWLWPLGLLSGMVTIGVLGVASCRRAVQVPPLTVLRQL